MDGAQCVGTLRQWSRQSTQGGQGTRTWCTSYAVCSFFSAHFIQLSSAHVQGAKNSIADAISCTQIDWMEQFSAILKRGLPAPCWPLIHHLRTDIVALRQLTHSIWLGESFNMLFCVSVLVNEGLQHQMLKWYRSLIPLSTSWRGWRRHAPRKGEARRSHAF